MLAAEKTLTEARGDEERLEAIVSELAVRLAGATKNEVITEARYSLNAAAIATNAQRIWWEKNGNQLKSMLQEVFNLHIARSDAFEEARRKQLKLIDYDDHFEISAIILKEVTVSQDIDDATWRTSEKLTDIWSWYTISPELDGEKEAA